MFYSHEVLRSREHGVATVWLLATLGPRSSLGRLARRDILQVDVAKACRTIAAPTAPMALRLQSNLLYGVSRVFDEQCSYVLSDVRSATSSIRHKTRASTSTLTDDQHLLSLRPERLLLADDPSFDLTNDTVSSQVEQGPTNINLVSMSTTPISSQRFMDPSNTQSRFIEVSSPLNKTRLFRSSAGSSISQVFSSDRSIPLARRVSDPPVRSVEDNVLQDADFAIDIDGNVVELNGGESTSIPISFDNMQSIVAPNTSAGAFSQDHSANRIPQRQETILQELPERVRINQLSQIHARSTSRMSSYSAVHDTDSHQRCSAEIVAELGRQVRQKKRLELDCGPLEIRNSEVAAWNENYVANMGRAKAATQKVKLITCVKKNALYLMWLAGLGTSGATAHLRSSGACLDPLHTFHGHHLHEWITKGRKRSHSEDASSPGTSGRRLKRYLTTPETARKFAFTHSQSGEARLLEHDNDIELGRGLPDQADLALQHDHEISPIMPWNLSSGRTSSIWNPWRTWSRSSATPMNHEQQNYRRSSHWLSASPLPELDNYGMASRRDYLQFTSYSGDMNDPIDRDDPHSFPGVQLTTEWHSKGYNLMDGERDNFIRFIIEAIDSRSKEMDAALTHISFHELLPLETTTAAVAAQALLNSLTLSGEGLLDIKQAEHFERINLIPLVKNGFGES